jgi:hypothetical protein
MPIEYLSNLKAFSDSNLREQPTWTENLLCKNTVNTPNTNFITVQPTFTDIIPIDSAQQAEDEEQQGTFI